MALLASTVGRHHAGTRPHAASRLPGRVLLAALLTAVFLVLLTDALMHPVAFFDVRLMQTIQRFDVPALYSTFHAIRTLTGSEGAIIAWVVVGLVFLARRWWAPAVALGLLPLGGVVNEGISLFLVERSRPHLETLARSSFNPEEHSFPSGHVTGAVILYGLILMASGRFRLAPVRYLVRAGSVVVIVVIGFQRVWGGAHWPTDVLAAYALGGVLLIALVSLTRWLEPELAGRTLPGAVGRLLTLPAELVGRRTALPDPEADRTSAAAWYRAHHLDSRQDPPPGG